MEIEYLKGLCEESCPRLQIINGDFEYRLHDLMKTITQFAPWQDIQAVIIFGSSMHQPIYRMKTHYVLWFFPIQKRIQVNAPRDLDILVLLKPGKWEIPDTCRPIFEKHHLPQRILWQEEGEYGSIYWEKGLLDNGLHLFLTDERGFIRALKEGHTVPTNILKEGNVIAGDMGEYSARHALWVANICTCQ